MSSAESDLAVREEIRAEFARIRARGFDDASALHQTAEALHLSINDCALELGLSEKLTQTGARWRI